MTDYRSWENYDVEEAEKAIEDDDLVEQHKMTRIKNTKSQFLNTKQLIETSRSEVEILQSQTAVSILKQSGGMGKNRMRQRNKTETKEAGDEHRSCATEDSEHALLILADYLSQLLRTTEELNRFTEQKTLHSLGLAVAWRSIRFFSIFNQLKYSITHDTLLAHRELVRERTFKTLQDLSSAEIYILDQVLSCLSLFSLSMGDFNSAADCARFVIKRQGNICDPGIWLIRGLSFLGMGVPYLCNLHFRSALGRDSDYLGLQEAVSFMEQLELEEAKLLYKVPYELLRSMMNLFCAPKQFLENTPNLMKLDISDCILLGDISLLSNYLGEGKESNSLHFVKQFDDPNDNDLLAFIKRVVSSFKYAEKSHFFSTSRLNQLHSALTPYSLEQSVSIVMYLLAHRLFYEGQSLYLESMYAAAEYRYAAVLILLEVLESKELVVPFSVNVEPFSNNNFFVKWKGTVMLNISGCRLHRGYLGASSLESCGVVSKAWNFDVSNVEVVKWLKFSSALELCNKASEYLPTLATSLRRLEILQKLNVKPHAGLLNVSAALGNVVIGDYGPAQVFSQVFSSGFPVIISSGLNKSSAEICGSESEEDEEILRIIEDFMGNKDRSSTSKILELYRLHGYDIFDLYAPPRTAFDPSNEEFVSPFVLEGLQRIIDNFKGFN